MGTKDMKESLIKMFTNKNFDFKNEDDMETFLTAFKSIHDKSQTLKAVRSKDEYICVRGCHIDRGSLFIKMTIDKDKEPIKICPRCMAIVLYFQEAYKPKEIMEW